MNNSEDFVCKYCGSDELYTEQHGNNVGLYCKRCGKYQRWLGKEELRVFNNQIKEKSETSNYIESISDIISDMLSVFDDKLFYLMEEIKKNKLSEGEICEKIEQLRKELY